MPLSTSLQQMRFRMVGGGDLKMAQEESCDEDYRPVSASDLFLHLKQVITSPSLLILGHSVNQTLLQPVFLNAIVLGAAIQENKNPVVGIHGLPVRGNLRKNHHCVSHFAYLSILSSALCLSVAVSTLFISSSPANPLGADLSGGR